MATCKQCNNTGRINGSINFCTCTLGLVAKSAGKQQEEKPHERNYIDLFEFLGPVVTKDFNYEHYAIEEQRRLKPALNRRGYTNVEFSMGEQDLFGPPSRICTAMIHGRKMFFCYG